jgi:hypothetical protein
MRIKMHFLWNPTLDEDGLSAYVDQYTTFGATITSAWTALGWRLSEWDFFFGPFEDNGLDRPVRRGRFWTPLMWDMDDDDEVEILCVPARVSN